MDVDEQLDGRRDLGIGEIVAGEVLGQRQGEAVGELDGADDGGDVVPAVGVGVVGRQPLEGGEAAVAGDEGVAAIGALGDQDRLQDTVVPDVGGEVFDAVQLAPGLVGVGIDQGQGDVDGLREGTNASRGRLTGCGHRGLREDEGRRTGSMAKPAGA